MFNFVFQFIGRRLQLRHNRFNLNPHVVQVLGPTHCAKVLERKCITSIELGNVDLGTKHSIRGKRENPKTSKLKLST